MSRPTIDQHVTFLYTRDLAATAAFYEDILELPLILDQGSCRIYGIGGTSFLGFCQRDEAPDRPSGVIITLVTSEVNAWHHFLGAKGITFEKPPTVNPDYNIYHCFLCDPNGYLLEIQEFLDPAWPKVNA